MTKVGVVHRIRRLWAEGHKAGKCLMLLRDWKVADMSPALGKGLQRLAVVEGGQAQPSPLIQARGSL